jgi:serine/threonine protein kinase
MGEVYRARDSKLKRDVPIKVLPDAFSRDAERVARFQREAEILASLNHPNIGAIYDLQQIGDSQLLVLELVEGETLAERLSRGPIHLEESLRIATQITDAFEAAHEKGIIHRDLKPANIKVTPAGNVKVLDFGIAKMRTTADASPATEITSNTPRRDPGNRYVYVARTSQRSGSGSHIGYLGFWLRALRDVHGQTCIRGSNGFRNHRLRPEKRTGLEEVAHRHSRCDSPFVAPLFAERSTSPTSRHRRCAYRDR